MKFINIIVLFFVLLLSNEANSKVIIVTTTANAGLGSFRKAVTEQAQPNDTIIINVKGDIELDERIDFNVDNITIIGPYAKHNRFKASASFTDDELFYMNGNNNISFYNISLVDFTGGNHVFNIVNSYGIKFENCLIENNDVSESGTFLVAGGSGSTVDFLNCSFMSNNAGNGGAIAVAFFSSSNITNCTFFQNSTNASTNKSGGAVWVGTSSTVVLTNNMFKDNSANDPVSPGHAIYVDNTSEATLSNNVITDNGSNALAQIFISGTVNYPMPGGFDTNIYKLNSGETTSLPFTPLPPGTDLKLTGSPITDGYGLKYFRIIDPSSPLVNKCPFDSGIHPLKDCRRAPRAITSNSSSYVDAGPVEYTPFIVKNFNSSGAESFSSVVSVLINSEPNFIEFDIPSYITAVSSSSIGISAQLQINVDVYIDGYSQPGTSIAGPDFMGGSGVTAAENLIPIDGPSSGNCLLFTNSNITLAGVNIYSTSSNGIIVSSSNVSTNIFGNHIGFDFNLTVQPNTNGISVNSPSVIGGNEHWQRNVIGGNTSSNIFLSSNTNTSNVTIKGNFIGVKPDGQSSFGNYTQKGIQVQGNSSHLNPTNVKIGGANFGSRNVISGNSVNSSSFGIYVYQTGPGLDINNNYIGVDYSGTTAIPNTGRGISVTTTTHTVNIGNLKANVISGNSLDGIFVNNATGITNIIENIIGMSADTITPISNVNDGVYCTYSNNINIGNVTKGNYISANGDNGIYLTGTDEVTIENNLISGNSSNGIKLDGNGTGTNIFNNLIGTTLDGASALANSKNGILVDDTHDVFIGGPFSNSQNIISGNSLNGISILSPNVMVAGNVIGLDASIQNAVPNGGNGIYVGDDGNGTIIGTPSENYIGGNIKHGIFIDNVDSCEIDNCFIGINGTLTLPVKNDSIGIYIYESHKTEVGSTYSNTIVGHDDAGMAGVLINDSDSILVLKNYIGITINDSIMSNYVGVKIIGTTDYCEIGDEIANGTKNIISGNNIGVLLDGASVEDNHIIGNIIGLKLNGLSAAANGIGIELTNGANDNYIGADGLAQKRNIISGNTIAGVHITGAVTHDNIIYRNLIGSNSLNLVSVQNAIGVWVENCNQTNYIGDDTHILNSPIISGNDRGIELENASNQQVNNCRIGTKTSGNFELPNTIGINIIGTSQYNEIGGNNITNPLSKNLISGNYTGIKIEGCDSNYIKGNYIGTNLTGTDSLSNYNGIVIDNGSANQIGTSDLGEGNLISCSRNAGVLLTNNTRNTQVHNNAFGTNNTMYGHFQFSENQFGILLLNCNHNDGNIIGGDREDNEDNTFTSNNPVSIGLNNSSNIAIRGNKIGLATGTSSVVPLGSVPGTFGIYVNDSHDNIIGGTNSGAENSIANIGYGIMLDNSDDNTISHNFIGNDTLGYANILGTDGVGVRVDSASINNIIGPNNVVSGNSIGVNILGAGTDNNHAFGNYIGCDIYGNSSIPNNVGVKIHDGAKNNLIGGVLSNKNIISGNTPAAVNAIGVEIEGLGTDNNIVSGNYIGLNHDGSSIIANDQGVKVWNQVSGNRIGGSHADSLNYISASTGGTAPRGLYLGANANNNKVIGNKFGLLTNNSPAGNSKYGILIENANNNTIGGIAAVDANEIANTIGTVNFGKGIVIKGNSVNNIVLGNSIHDNNGLGIDLGDNHITSDNSGAFVQGDVQMPIILQAFDCNADGNTEVAIKFRDLVVNGNYIIEFYTLDGTPDSNGEGAVFKNRVNFVAVAANDTLNFVINGVGNTVEFTATVTALNNGGTSEYAENFTVTNTPLLTVGSNNESCNGVNDGNITVETNEYNYTHFTDDSNSFLDSTYINSNTNTTTSFTYPTGNYVVDVEYLNGCTVQSLDTIKIGPQPIIDSTTVSDTCGLGIGSYIVFQDGGDGTSPAFYEYNSGSGNTAISSGSAISATSGTVDYIFMTAVYGSTTCNSDTLAINIQDYTLPQSNLEFEYSMCNGGMGQVTNVPDYAGGSYSSIPVGINSTTGIYTGITFGTNYQLVYTYGTCSFALPNITPAAALNAEFSYDGDGDLLDTLCHLSDLVPGITNPGGEFSISGLNSPIIDVDGVIYATPETYDVTYITSQSSCPDTVVHAVTILATPLKPNITATNFLICHGETIDSIYTQLSVLVNWYTDTTATAIATSQSSYVPLVGDMLQIDNYFYAKNIDANGCASNHASVIIQKPILTNMAADDDMEICLGGTVTVGASGAFSYYWPNINDGSSEQTEEVQPIVTTNYAVVLKDINGCEIFDTVKVTIKDPSDCNIEIHTAFSPNGDGLNDTWIINSIEGYPVNKVFIYNRWGDIVTEIENYDNNEKVWKGESRLTNKIVAPGTYFYTVDVEGEVPLSGWAQVVR